MRYCCCGCAVYETSSTVLASKSHYEFSFVRKNERHFRPRYFAKEVSGKSLRISGSMTGMSRQAEAGDRPFARRPLESPRIVSMNQGRWIATGPSKCRFFVE